MRSACAFVCSKSSVGAVIVSVVSSAYVYMFECFDVSHMSLIYRLNSVVESVLPCGIPSVMSFGSDFVSIVVIFAVFYYNQYGNNGK